ncbi:MAG: hypothetical protein A3J55_02745 [Candidatus Ryanbacteria bacterium RIFCSPHIGHO2_02_FULL_45_17b]|nr:MAG: hypothetical protein A3J55_02745 [Candidatus Ryanbacteria bacterium RIFCSPHIGHO2_02_FULL_45_17b]
MKAIRLFLLVLIIVGLGLLATQGFWVPKFVAVIIKYTDEADPSQIIIFEKRSSWGPCPDEGGCFEFVHLYESGKLVVEDGEGKHESQLPKDFVERFNKTVEETGIMQKKCLVSSPILDYGASYTIVHNGREKKIEFPGCEEELKVIDALFMAQD